METLTRKTPCCISEKLCSKNPLGPTVLTRLSFQSLYFLHKVPNEISLCWYIQLFSLQRTKCLQIFTVYGYAYTPTLPPTKHIEKKNNNFQSTVVKMRVLPKNEGENISTYNPTTTMMMMRKTTVNLILGSFIGVYLYITHNNNNKIIVKWVVRSDSSHCFNLKCGDDEIGVIVVGT